MQVWMNTANETHWLVSPKHKKQTLQFLSAQGMNYKLEVQDMAVVINDQKIAMMAADFDVEKSPMEDYWDNYHDYDQQVKMYQKIASLNPKICKVVKMGKTSEGRDMYVLQIGESREKPMCYNQVHVASV